MRPASGGPRSAREAGDPTLKIAPGVPRVVPLAEAEAAARAAAARIPVTRLADLTRLDRIGLPVFCAVTPLAKDLTTHMGKGASAGAARVSALMEAVERVSAERLPSGSRRASFEEMRAGGLPVLDPALFDLPPDSAYDPARPIDWVEGDELIGGGRAWIAADLAISPPAEGVLRQVDTNGLAAGSTWLEAVLHGLCEVIERDAVGRATFAALYADPEDGATAPRRLDLTTAPEPCRALIGSVEARGLQVAAFDLTADIAVPTIRALILDPAWPTPRGPVARRFVGLGSDPSAGVALGRAVTEAAQSRLANIQGARDSFNRLPPSRRPATLEAERLDLAADAVPFSTVPSFASDDLAEDLAHVRGALAAAGFRRAVAVDLTCPEFGIAVVRIRVPGLCAFFVDRSRAGWRSLSLLL